MVIGRFAPTPSGRMHLGNAFAALLAWLSVRAQGGRMLLRIEDLDLVRTRPAYTAALKQDLAWLGLDWDTEVPNQSTRTTFYEAQLEKLREKGLLYPCFCSRSELHAATAPHASDGSYVYSGRCARLTPEQAAQKGEKRPGALRVRVPNETLCLADGVQGVYEENLARGAGDFIVRRSDGVFAYQLAAPADDGDAGVSEVVRGRDLLPSAPRQSWLMRQLGYTPPAYYHLPMLLAPGGRRLSKRDADLDLGALRARGLSPAAITGLLAQLAGLVPTAEPLAPPQLVPLFEWGRIHKQDAQLPEDFL